MRKKAPGKMIKRKEIENEKERRKIQRLAFIAREQAGAVRWNTFAPMGRGGEVEYVCANGRGWLRISRSGHAKYV